MPLLHLIFILAAVGVVLYLIKVYVPMDEKIKKIINVVVVIAVIVWLLYQFGVLPASETITVPKVK